MTQNVHFHNVKTAKLFSLTTLDYHFYKTMTENARLNITTGKLSIFSHAKSEHFASGKVNFSMNIQSLTYDAKVTAETSKPGSLVWYTIER